MLHGVVDLGLVLGLYYYVYDIERHDYCLTPPDRIESRVSQRPMSKISSTVKQSLRTCRKTPCSMTKGRSKAWKGVAEAIYGSPSHKIFDVDGPSATPAFQNSVKSR